MLISVDLISDTTPGSFDDKLAFHLYRLEANPGTPCLGRMGTRTHPYYCDHAQVPMFLERTTGL